jgi:hypothetical protein
VRESRSEPMSPGKRDVTLASTRCGVGGDSSTPDAKPRRADRQAAGRYPCVDAEESGEGRNRTADTRFFRPVLCQLSYLALNPLLSPPRRGRSLELRRAGTTGFEPATSGLTGRRAEPDCATPPRSGTSIRQLYQPPLVPDGFLRRAGRPPCRTDPRCRGGPGRTASPRSRRPYRLERAPGPRPPGRRRRRTRRNRTSSSRSAPVA